MEHNELVELKEKILKYKEKYGEKSFLDNFEEEILELNNYFLSYVLGVYFYTSKKSKHQDVIVKSKNIDINYLFAKNVSDIDASKNGKVILESRDVKYNYLFARDINIKDKEPFAKIVLESSNTDYIYLFALSVSKVDKVPFINYLLKHGRFDLISNLQNYINDDDNFKKYVASLNARASFNKEKKQKYVEDTKEIEKELNKINVR